MLCLLAWCYLILFVNDGEAIITLRLIVYRWHKGWGSSQWWMQIRVESSSESLVAWIQVPIGISVLQNKYSGLKHVFRIEAYGFCFPRIGDLPFWVLQVYRVWHISCQLIVIFKYTPHLKVWPKYQAQILDTYSKKDYSLEEGHLYCLCMLCLCSCY